MIILDAQSEWSIFLRFDSYSSTAALQYVSPPMAVSSFGFVGTEGHLLTDAGRDFGKENFLVLSDSQDGGGRKQCTRIEYGCSLVHRRQLHRWDVFNYNDIAWQRVDDSNETQFR